MSDVPKEALDILRIRKAARTYFGPDLTDTQWAVMLVVFTMPPLGKTHMFRSVISRADLPRNTVVRALMKLEADGLVSIVPHPDDKRAMSVRPTQKAIEALEKTLATAALTRL